MTNRRARIDHLEEMVRHASRREMALLAGYDALTESHRGAQLAAETLAAENNHLDDQLRAVTNLANELTASGSSAYRKAGNRLLEILNGHQPAQAVHVVIPHDDSDPQAISQEVRRKTAATSMTG